MKTSEELIALKNEEETVSRKLCELTDEELVQVTGGATLSESIDAYKEWSDYLKALRESIRMADSSNRCETVNAARKASQKAIDIIIADKRLTDMHKRLLLNQIEHSF